MNCWILCCFLFMYNHKLHFFVSKVIYTSYFLAMSADRRPPPEFVSALPIRKTRAGLQFTCATATLGLNAHNLKDVWVCNR